MSFSDFNQIVFESFLVLKTFSGPIAFCLRSVIVEALKVDSLQKLCSSLEPILRRVVRFAYSVFVVFVLVSLKS